MHSNIFRRRETVFLIVIAVVVIGIASYFIARNFNDKPTVNREAETIATDVSTPLSSELPLSPLSAISPMPSPGALTVELEQIQLKIQEGIKLYEAAEYEKAIEVFSDILEQDPSSIIAYNSRGSAYQALDEYQKALADYSKAIEMEPNFASAHYNRGRLYTELERYEDALADLQEAVELAPTEFGYRAYGNIGLTYHKSGDYEKAIEAFNTSVSYNNQKADVYYFRGETYTALKNYEAAIADYQAAIGRFSNYDLAYQAQGYAYYKTGQYEEALEAAKQALEISPDSPVAHFYLTLVYLAQGQVDEAKAEATQAVETLDSLAEKEQAFILARVRADLETFGQENPDRAEVVGSIIEVIPEP